MKSFSEAIASAGFGFRGPHLVAASAGTGKTYSIQNIYARLVAEEGLRVSEIQVMTFTDPATKELRDRIRRVVSGFRARLAGDAPDDGGSGRFDSLFACLEARGIAPSAARLRLELALAEFDRAAISTIHGFCRRALARHAFETGAPFDVELTASDDAVLDRMTRDWWRRERRAAPADVRDGLDLGRLAACVRRLAARPDALIQADEGTADGYTLARAEEIASAYHASRGGRMTRTFDELLLSLRDALRADASGALAKRLREDYKAVVVDEFQDTDPVQYEIFRRAFLDAPDGERPSLFFVGDPKQAIYSFRGGDIFTYRSAALRPDVAAATFRLQKNHRSAPGLVDAVNLLFRDAKTESGEMRRTFGDDTIGYPDDIEADASRPALQTGGTDDPRPFRVVNVRKHDGMPVSDGVRAAVVESVLDVLAEQSGRLTPRDVAVLVSSHAAGALIAAALKARGVPSVLRNAGNVFAQPVASDFLTLLQAMSQNGGTGRVRAAMLTPFFDFAPCDVDAGPDDEALADMAALFRRLGDVWRARGFDAALAELENDPRCDFRRRFAAMPGGERMLADAFQLEDLAVAAVKSQGPSPDALVAWVAERIRRAAQKGPEERSEEYARELESEHDAVRIMTMHASKGLEFPVAIIPLPAREPPGDDAPYGFHDADGETFRFSMEKTPAHLREAREERIRLLYVALTRATQRTVLVVPETVPDSWPVREILANAACNSSVRGTARPSPIAVVEDYVPRDLPDYEPPRASRGPARPVVERRRFDRAPSMGSYSSLAPGSHSDSDGRDRDSFAAPAAESGGARHAIFSLPGGAKTGTCWHDVLERVDFAADDAALERAVVSSLAVHGLPGEDAPTVSAMMRATLDFRLEAPDGGAFSLRDVPTSQRFSEWEFHFSSRDAARTTAAARAVIERHWRNDPSKRAFLRAMEGWDRPVPRGFLKGYMDLVFRHGGFWYVVDWKSNMITGDASGFTEEGVAGEMALHGYFFQYLLYAAVLHRYLKETVGGKYSWERNFGGVRYFFLRGVAAGCPAAVYRDRPCEALLDGLADALGMEDAR